MGAAAVWQLKHNVEENFDACKVAGPSSSIRAEAAAMYIAIHNAPQQKHITVFTDSMNVIFALQVWYTEEFRRDMRWQKQADIIKLILTCINQQSAPTHVVKVKSHIGVYLNERADVEAGAAAAADAELTDT